MTVTGLSATRRSVLRNQPQSCRPLISAHVQKQLIFTVFPNKFFCFLFIMNKRVTFAKEIE